MNFLNQEITVKIWQLLVAFLVVSGVMSFIEGFVRALWKDIRPTKRAADVCHSCGTTYATRALYCHNCGTRR